VLVLIAASKATFKLAESRNAMNTIRRYAADDAHVIYGTAYDETLGDQLRVTVIATGLSSTRRAQATPPLSVVQQPMQALRTGTDNIPVLSQVAQPGPAMQQPQAMSGNHGGNTAHAGHAAPAAQAYEGLNTPSVWRTNRTHAAAKVDALASNGMDEIEIPAFLRKQAD
jgi:cell division protein FtsZ